MVNELQKTSLTEQKTSLLLNSKSNSDLRDVKSEFNSMFDENNQIKIKLTNRGENKRSGISYDYYYGNSLNKGLHEYFKLGLFEDVTKDDNGQDCFSSQDRLNLEKKFAEIHKNKNYSLNFNNMKTESEFVYTKEEFLALAEAAGYKLKNSETGRQKAQMAISVVEPDSKVLQTKATTALTSSIGIQKSGIIGNVDMLVENYADSTEEDILTAIQNDKELRNATPEERLDILKDRKRVLYNEKQALTKRPDNKRMREIEAQLKQIDFYETYIKQVQASDYWHGRKTPEHAYDENGEVSMHNGTYTKVTIKDNNGNERRVARIDKYNPVTYDQESTYHPVTVMEVGNPKYEREAYFDVVADVERKLENMKEIK